MIIPKFRLSVNYFMNLSLVVYLKSSLYPRSSRFSPVLPSGSLLVFHLTVRCKIHLELIFVKDVRSVSRFIVFECRCLFVSEPYAEKDIFTPFYSLGSFVKDQLLLFMWLCVWALGSVGLFVYSFENTMEFLIAVPQQ